MYFIVEIFLTSLCDMLIWFKSMATLGCKENKGRFSAVFLGYYIMLLGKRWEQSYINNSSLSVMISIILVVYILIATFWGFKGTLHEKVIHVGLFFGVLFISELLVIELYINLFNGNWDSVMTNSTISLVCYGVSKAFQAGGCFLIFYRKNLINNFLHKQKVVIATIVFNILLVIIMLKNVRYQESSSVIFLFTAIEIFFLWYIICSILVTKKKNKQITNLKKEAQNDTNRRNWVQDMEHFKQNLSDSIWIMRNLCYHKDYEQLGEFMDEVFGEVDRQELLFKHANISVRILVSELIQKAKEMRIRFNKTILVNEFGMEDEEICSILKNLVMNGLEAATKVPPDIAHVTLQVLPTKGGYEIRCINDCIGAVDFSKTTKKDRNNHGYGVAIVEEIVKRNHGTIERRYTSAEREGMGIVAVSIIFNSKS